MDARQRLLLETLAWPAWMALKYHLWTHRIHCGRPAMWYALPLIALWHVARAGSAAARRRRLADAERYTLHRLRRFRRSDP